MLRLTSCNRLNWSARYTRCISSFVASPTADFERPTPIVLIATEGYKSELWLPFATYASQRGYSGMCISAPLLPSFYAAADHIHSDIAAAKLTPPIIVAHSAATFAAQKYLESYALSGLVLIDPFAPRGAKHQLTQWLAQEQTQIRQSMQQNQQAAADTFRWTKDRIEILAHKVQAIIANPSPDEDVVNLERGCVPTLVVTTDCGRRLLSDLQLRELVDLHAVAPEDVIHFSSESNNSSNGQGIDHCSGKKVQQYLGIPMIDHADEFNRRIIDWIENIT